MAVVLSWFVMTVIKLFHSPQWLYTRLLEKLVHLLKDATIKHVMSIMIRVKLQRDMCVFSPLLYRICGPFAPITPNIEPMKLDDVPVQPSNQALLLQKSKFTKSKQTCKRARGNQIAIWFTLALYPCKHFHTHIDTCTFHNLTGISERSGCTLSIEWNGCNLHGWPEPLPLEERFVLHVWSDWYYYYFQVL